MKEKQTNKQTLRSLKGKIIWEQERLCQNLLFSEKIMSSPEKPEYCPLSGQIKMWQKVK